MATMVRLDMVPPPAEGDAEVERALRVLVDVFCRKGHMALDCLRRDSMAKAVVVVLRECRGVAGPAVMLR